MQTAFIRTVVQCLIVYIAAGMVTGYAQRNSLTVQLDTSQKQLMFAGYQIQQAARQQGYDVRIVQAVSVDNTKGIVIKIIPDSVAVRASCRDAKLKQPQSLNWQCYAIRMGQTNGLKNIYVLAGDPTGAMYGGLDIAEAIRQHTFATLAESDNKPYLDRRGIKFNVPLDLRTPSYSDPSDASQQNMPDVWNESFWQTYLDEMAQHRYNVLSLWSLHPFPSLVKIPEFPDVALQDVWRTREKFDDSIHTQASILFVRTS